MRRILHLDMDAFFAAVEQKRHRELIGKPVVIGGSGDPTQRGVVATASYEARKFGIHSAMPLRTALKLCPQAVFLPVDYPVYVRASGEVKEVIRTLTPVMEDVGIDEVFADISAAQDDPASLARLLKQRIREHTGLTCSVGIGPNKLIAKIASDLEKPDGLTIVEEGQVTRILWPLPVRKLWGVGPKTEAALHRHGIQTIGELAVQPGERLVDLFGPPHGRYLFSASRGIDDSPLVTTWEAKSISREVTFQSDLGNWQEIARHLADLVKGVGRDMKEAGYRGRTFTVKVRFGDFQTLTRAVTLPILTDEEEAIRKAAFACLKRVVLTKRVRLLGVRATNLEKAGNETPAR